MHITKLSNAFYPEAALSLAGAGMIGASGGVGAAVGYGSTRKMLGGLWVGGTVEITGDGLRFTANKMNQVMHKSGTIEPVWIPMANIRSVTIPGGWITKIVAITHTGGEFRFRCYGARAVADQLQAYLASLEKPLT